jgi:hypothetical protein
MELSADNTPFCGYESGALERLSAKSEAFPGGDRFKWAQGNFVALLLSFGRRSRLAILLSYGTGCLTTLVSCTLLTTSKLLSLALGLSEVKASHSSGRFAFCTWPMQRL